MVSVLVCFRQLLEFVFNLYDVAAVQPRFSPIPHGPICPSCQHLMCLQVIDADYGLLFCSAHSVTYTLGHSSSIDYFKVEFKMAKNLNCVSIEYFHS